MNNGCLILRKKSHEIQVKIMFRRARVARVQILSSTSYVGWVSCWSFPLLREVFLWELRFSPLLKNQRIQIPILDLERADTFKRLLRGQKNYKLQTFSFLTLNAIEVKQKETKDLFVKIFHSLSALGLDQFNLAQKLRLQPTHCGDKRSTLTIKTSDDMSGIITWRP